MKTNREEILQNCLSVFATMNYERASITELSRACGLSRMAIHHYFPNKQAVFTAVVDRYVFGVQDPANKFGASEGSLADFIDNYLDGIVRTMRQIVGLCAGKTEGGGAVAPNFHYFNLMLQTRRYYPGAERKFEQLYRKTRTYWRKAVQRAAETGAPTSTSRASPTCSIRFTSGFRSNRPCCKGSTSARWPGSSASYTSLSGPDFRKGRPARSPGARKGANRQNESIS